MNLTGNAANVTAAAREPLLAMARRRHVPAVAVVMGAPLEACLARNAARPGPAPGARWGRRVPELAVRKQHSQLLEALSSLAGEGFDQVVTYRPPANG